MSLRLSAACTKILIGRASLKMFIVLSHNVLFVNKLNMTPINQLVSYSLYLFLQLSRKMSLWTSSLGYHRPTNLPLFLFSCTNFQKELISGHSCHTIPRTRLPCYFLTWFVSTMASHEACFQIRIRCLLANSRRNFSTSMEPSSG